ncbi:type II toxin-antitoxin system Phd/YefM family antitoxin [Methylophilus aquaticus]|uniref:Type II toxin-antitoxin system prevent-host-death family antitoxin n=1 Tax=Methylophilus aquaticus TaxID=1971610 RepID=A0ABT9JPC6_9PROT|nr:type II toxin-antitoxin system prevent-host-death family antitoxin [Methylophilus aquaticus]MDP8566431.1 type II toxin-antitoxin system prevent-host-death family antitoxin [Methylophilus aquaticus]
MTQFNIAEAKANFSSLVKKAMMGEEVIIAKDNKPLLKLSPIVPEKPKKPQPGTGKGSILYIADDFDATPEGFEDYV